MKTVKTDVLAPLTDAQIAQLDALDSRTPDTTDIPEAPAENWRNAKRHRNGLHEEK